MTKWASKMRCVVITPEAPVVDTEVYDVVLPAYDGLRGIMIDHAPLMCRLGTGLLRYHDGQNQLRVVFVDGGFGHVRDNEVTILTRSAFTPETLTAEQVRQELRQAEEMATTTIEEVRSRGAALQRAKQLVGLVENRQ